MTDNTDHLPKGTGGSCEGWLMSDKLVLTMILGCWLDLTHLTWTHFSRWPLSSNHLTLQLQLPHCNWGLVCRNLSRIQPGDQVILSMVTMRTFVAGQELASNILSIEYSNVLLYGVWLVVVHQSLIWWKKICPQVCWWHDRNRESKQQQSFNSPWHEQFQQNKEFFRQKHLKSNL